MLNHLLSTLPDVIWPALPSSRAAGLLAVLFQLEQSQWLSPDELRTHQLSQLNRVIEYASREIPFYKDRLRGIDSVANLDDWLQLPLLTRRDIQHAGQAMYSSALPDGHGAIRTSMTGGSTNQPVVTLATGLTDFFWHALTIRDHLWHKRDLRQSFAAIRYTGKNDALLPMGAMDSNWGAATRGVCETGPAHLLNIRSTIEEQATWLARINPGYILSYPSVLRAIAEKCAPEVRRLTNLKELRTFGEILEPQCRAICEQAFGVKVVDMYSSEEVGYIALQCPDHLHYHVQAENLLVEVVRDDGNPCAPGEIGRVVVSTLHNFAMPLVRYDIGDYAEVGEPCPCGRGLPVLKRILGRQRNLLVMPSGERVWPLFNAGERPEELPPFYQFQVVQRTREQLEINVVRHAPLTTAEEETVVRYMRQSLGYPFEISIHCVDTIQRSPTGKFEDFISHAE